MSSPSDAADHVSRLMRMLEAHWVMTLATSPPQPGAPPHCAPLFYALGATADDGAPILVFTSNPESVHGTHLGAGPTPSGAAIYLESETVGELRGAQLRGPVDRLEAGDAREADARTRYLKRHPVARDLLAAGRHRLYAMRVRWAKLTDNRLGFGQHPIVDFGRDLEV